MSSVSFIHYPTFFCIPQGYVLLISNSQRRKDGNTAWTGCPVHNRVHKTFTDSHIMRHVELTVIYVFGLFEVYPVKPQCIQEMQITCKIKRHGQKLTFYLDARALTAVWPDLFFLDDFFFLTEPFSLTMYSVYVLNVGS